MAVTVPREDSMPEFQHNSHSSCSMLPAPHHSGTTEYPGIGTGILNSEGKTRQCFTKLQMPDDNDAEDGDTAADDDDEEEEPCGVQSLALTR